MNANIDIGLTHLDEAVTPLTEATQHIQTALETTTNALHGTADRFALDALAAMAKAHARAERAAALIAEGVSNINSYREVVQRQAQRP
jgi:hypothetical protein